MKTVPWRDGVGVGVLWLVLLVAFVLLPMFPAGGAEGRLEWLRVGGFIFA